MRNPREMRGGQMIHGNIKGLEHEAFRETWREKHATHSRNDLLDLFLVTLHLQHIPDLYEVHTLPIPQAYYLVESLQNFERVLGDLTLIHSGATHICDDASKEVEGVDVL